MSTLDSVRPAALLAFTEQNGKLQTPNLGCSKSTFLPQEPLDEYINVLSMFAQYQ